MPPVEIGTIEELSASGVARRWRERRRARLPVRTIDDGWIWRRDYWAHFARTFGGTLIRFDTVKRLKVGNGIYGSGFVGYDEGSEAEA